MRSLTRSAGQREAGRTYSAPLAFCATASFIEGAHLEVGGRAAVNMFVIIGAVCVAPTLCLEFTTDGNIISFWYAIAVMMDEFTIVHTAFNAPFGFDKLLFHPCTFAVTCFFAVIVSTFTALASSFVSFILETLVVLAACLGGR